MGEGFQSDKITLSTNIWLYMYSHPLQCHGELLGGIEKVGACHKKKVVGSQATPGPGSRRNFSEASKILHLPHKKNVGK